MNDEMSRGAAREYYGGSLYDGHVAGAKQQKKT
jgi:hypothetical protein